MEGGAAGTRFPESLGGAVTELRDPFPLTFGGKKQSKKPVSLPPSPFQDAVLQNRQLWRLIKALFRFRSSSRYRVLQRELEGDAMWPPLNGRDLAEDGSSRDYLNPAYEPEEAPGNLGSCAGGAGRAQPEGSSSGASPAEPREEGGAPEDQQTQAAPRWHPACSEGASPDSVVP